MKNNRFRMVSPGKPTVVRSLFKRYFSHGVGRSAAALAYYLIFSFFPFLVLLSAILSFLDLPSLTAANLHGLLPEDIINVVNSYLFHVGEVKSASLLLFGIVFTVYFVMRSVNCLFQSIHKAYRIKAKSLPLRHQIHVFLSTILLIVIVFAALLLMTMGRSALTFLSQFIAIDMGSIDIWNMLRFLILGAMLFAVLLLLYYLVPNRYYSLRQVLPGTFGALVSWLLVSVGFAFYVENMGNYSVIYGSIGAVIVLLLWLYFSAIALIMGAELNCILADRPKKHKSENSFENKKDVK